jgi:hypothetical protein
MKKWKFRSNLSQAASGKQTVRPDPGLPELMPTMMDALWHFPEARTALRDALHAFATEWYSQPWPPPADQERSK